MSSIKMASKIFSIILIIQFAAVTNQLSVEEFLSQCSSSGAPCNPHYAQPCCNQTLGCIFIEADVRFVCAEKGQLGSRCWENGDCVSTKHLECSEDYKCVCKKHFKESKSVCKSLIGGYCNRDEECLTSNAVCIRNECDCGPNFFLQMELLCVPIVLGVSCSGDEFCEQIKFAKCSEKGICECTAETEAVNPIKCASVINGVCFSDADCYIMNSICVNNVCKCRENYVLSSISDIACVPGYLNMPCPKLTPCDNVIPFTSCSKDNRCACRHNYLQINGTSCGLKFAEECEIHELCGTANAACIEGECQCRAGFIYRNGKCLPTFLDADCQFDEDCSEIMNAICAEKKCTCQENYWQVGKTCEPALDGKCASDSDCVTPNSDCIDNICQCRAGYRRSASKRCTAARLGQSCSESKECKEIPYAHCFDQSCQCRAQYAKVNATVCAPKLGEFCWNGSLCAEVNAVCIDYHCQCRDGHLAQSDTKCVKTYLTKYCQFSDDCEVRHSKCFRKRCRCRDGYVPHNETTCMPLLGEFCWKSEKCAVDNSVCVNNECHCKKDYSRQSNNRCLPTILGQFCRVNADCNGIRYAECIENSCVCQSNSLRSKEGRCKSLINGECESTEDCYLFNSYCIDGRCQCLSNFIPQSSSSCAIIYLNKVCADNNDCASVGPATCSKHQMCVCDPDHATLNDSICVPRLYTRCENQCLTDNADCIEGVCQCGVNYTYQTNKYCKPMHLHLNCMHDIDCEIVEFARCVEKKCVCGENYVEADVNYCRPLLGGFCNAKRDCVTDDADCIENRCRCSENFVNVTNHQCIAEWPEKFCHVDADCWEIENAECPEDKACRCKENHRRVNNTFCEPLLGGFCLKNRDCRVPNSVCVFNKCKCSRFYTAKSSDRCDLRQPCNDSIDCATIPNAGCSDGKVCDCPENFIAFDAETCLPALGGFCSEDRQCRYNTMHCVDHKCQCKADFRAISDRQCRNVSSITSCSAIEECGDPWHYSCRNGQCVCREQNVAVDDWTCRPIINGLCWTEHQCVVKNSGCIDFRCQCKPGFVAVADNFCV